MKFDATFLRSKVARRVFFLFILCALLPITVLAIISFSHVSQQLKEQSHKRLHQASKSVGMAVYERLLFLEAEMKLIGSNLGGSGDPAKVSLEGLGKDLAKRFKTLALQTDKGRSITLLGRIEVPRPLTAGERRHIGSGKTLVASETHTDHPARVFMAMALDPQRPDRGILLAELNTVYLWGLGDEATLPPRTDMCVLKRSQDPMICSLHRPGAFAEEIAPLMANSGSRYFEWQDREQEYLASFWSIPLKFRFFSPTWTVVLTESKAAALAPMADFKKTFPGVVLLSLWVVALFSLIQIRRSLVPLEKLQEGTRRIAMRDFGSRVTVTSGDEFEELAESFNTMAGQLGRQFHTLATIGEIDRAVLSALEANTIVDTVLARMRDVFPCDWISVTLRDSEVAHAAWTYLRSGTSESDTLVEAVELTLTDLQTLHENPAHLVIMDKHLPAFLTPLTTRGARSFLVLPLFRAQRLSGFITLGYRDQPVQGQEELAQARQLADQVASALANAHDVEERKRAEALLQESNRRLGDTLGELKTTQKQMIQQERLRALGQMASGIAHDFNNTLSPILGFSELLLLNPKTLDDKDKAKERLRIIHTAAQDATKVVSRLREFYRPREKEDLSAPVNLKLVVEQTIRLTQPKWKDQALADGITVNMAAELQDVSPIGGDESELREVLTNLIFNAVDALAEDGTITLRTRPDGEHVILEVSDTGAGMTEEVRQHCLEPFFSTKGERGTGLGLSMVYGIIQRHQGTVDLESEPGKGTTFRIRLPVQGERTPMRYQQEGTDIGTKLHVLVVDDDALVCRVTTEYLISIGYTVETALSGNEALEKFRAGRFDLVVTDQGMPRMSGDQLASAVKRVAPNTPVILLTGAGKTVESAAEDSKAVDFIVSKPLSMAALRRVLAKVKALEHRLRPEPETVTDRP